MIRFAIILALLPCQALAQQQQSPIEQALSQKILAEVNAGLACSAQLIEVKKQLDEAQAKLKDFESKAKPGAPPS